MASPKVYPHNSGYGWVYRNSFGIISWFETEAKCRDYASQFGSFEG